MNGICRVVPTSIQCLKTQQRLMAISQNGSFIQPKVFSCLTCSKEQQHLIRKLAIGRSFKMVSDHIPAVWRVCSRMQLLLTKIYHVGACRYVIQNRWIFPLAVQLKKVTSPNGELVQQKAVQTAQHVTMMRRQDAMMAVVHI